jgi:NAD(P)-dependent dehydrogenase (short-subunit alcohol dehydrogenase family)
LVNSAGINYNEKLSEANISQHPAGKVGNVDDIAEMVLFLLREKASFITGQYIVVDGGVTKKKIYI